MDPVSVAIEVSGAAAAGGAAEAGAAATIAAEAAEVTAAVAKTAETVSEIAKIIPNPVAAEEAAGLAETAVKSTDIAAGEKAINEFSNLPNSLGAPKEIPIETTQAIDKPIELTKEQEVTAKTITESDLQRWDQENPRPDPETNPEGYKKWCEDREIAEIDYITNAKTELAMKDWDQKNPEPNKTKEPEKHKEWLEKRTKQENSLKEKIKKETEQLKNNERAAVVAEINRLRELYSVRIDIVEAIKALRRKEVLSDEDKITLGKLQDRRMSIDSEIKMIETDLKSKQFISGPLIALMIATAFVSMQIYKVGQQEKVF